MMILVEDIKTYRHLNDHSAAMHFHRIAREIHGREKCLEWDTDGEYEVADGILSLLNKLQKIGSGIQRQHRQTNDDDATL